MWSLLKETPTGSVTEFPLKTYNLEKVTRRRLLGEAYSDPTLEVCSEMFELVGYPVTQGNKNSLRVTWTAAYITVESRCNVLQGG